jgi:hypothetical protein
MNRFLLLLFAVVVGVVVGGGNVLCADQGLDGDGVQDPNQDRGQRLAKYLTNKKLVGQFTVDGASQQSLKVEQYEISKCQKLAQPDRYRLTARIKYGAVDQEVPLELTILFAGDTPVITLDSMWIPGMGTFDARVLIRRDRYAGTWKHDAKGGHLFGRIESMETKSEESAE